MGELRHGKTTGLLLKAFFAVHNRLGYGFLEAVYQKSMTIASQKLGVRVEQKFPISVHYEGILVGEYEADLLANDAVIVEIKAAKALAEEHEAQLLNYLKATPYEVGLLLNFGPNPQYLRRIMDNSRKGDFSWLKAK